MVNKPNTIFLFYEFKKPSIIKKKKYFTIICLTVSASVSLYVIIVPYVIGITAELISHSFSIIVASFKKEILKVYI